MSLSAPKLASRVDREALVLGHRLQQVLDTLEQLRRLTATLLRYTPDDPGQIDAWLARAGFAVDASGFFRQPGLLARVRAEATPPDEPIFAWAAALRDDPVIRFHMFALRELGEDLTQLRARLKGVAWIYYQDVRNAALVFPSMDIAEAIPADFDWRRYHTYKTVAPGANPEREICWTEPNIDYGGEGLIVSASIPLYRGDDFFGLWSIDVPVNYLISASMRQTPLAKGQCDFITDADGNLLMHPTFAAEINRDKGTIHHRTLADLDIGFESISLADMRESSGGAFLLRARDGSARRCAYQLIDGLDWMLFSTVPAPAGEAGGAQHDTLVSVSDGLSDSAGSGGGGDEDPLLGAVFKGRYRLQRRLGAGGHGVVYHALDLELDRPVAIKVLRRVSAGDKRRRGRFMREGSVARRVAHPNAVRVLDHGVDGGRPYLVMELLSGRSLARRLREEGPLPLAESLELAATAADVLVSLHSMQLIHRDVKPANLYLHDGGGGEQLKLLDFGLAKVVDELGPRDGSVTQPGQLIGTPTYMAPEMATGAGIEARADIYSLGISLFELLVGEPPFKSAQGGPLQIVLKHLREQPPRLSLLRPEAPPQLDQLVARMLAKEPEDRPTAVQVRRALLELLAALTSARP